MTYIDLEPIHIQWADHFAKLRFEQSRRAKRIPGNNGPVGPEPDVVGCRGEVAGKLYLNPVEWLPYTEGSVKQPDLGGFIDVRAITASHHSLIVKRNDPDAWAYLLIDGTEHPRHRVVGWLWGHEAKRYPILDPRGNRPAHFVRQDALHDPASLVAILRARP